MAGSTGPRVRVSWARVALDRKPFTPKRPRATSAAARVAAVRDTAATFSAPAIKAPERTIAAAAFGARSDVTTLVTVFSVLFMAPK